MCTKKKKRKNKIPDNSFFISFKFSAYRRGIHVLQKQIPNTSNIWLNSLIFSLSIQHWNQEDGAQHTICWTENTFTQLTMII